MSDERRQRKPARPDTVSVPVRLSAELDQQVADAAEQVGLSKQDVMRLAMERGIKVLMAQLLGQNEEPVAG